ncbi:MAG TPA: PBP1A family penicillin-binding protein [Pyrinomonadaceae bacterium]|nr:PBP1A family penicillin-binding protein [Pyrinomonadaceae bacterium]
MKFSEKSRSRSFFAPLRLCVRLFATRLQSRKARFTITIFTLALISLSAFFVNSYRSYAKIVDARLARGYLISRAGIYAAPRTLRSGQRLSPEALAVALRRAGYLNDENASEIWNGSFSIRDAAVEIRPNNSGGFPSVLRVSFDSDGRIAQLTGDEVTLDSFTLAPESLTNDPLTKGGARRQLNFKDIPPVLVQAITSIEDRRFFDHPGLDLFGIARALLRNAGDERLGQGGSTITQQLVKNTYLTPERTLRRKYAEAMLAFTIERRLSKEDIFALYCNEIYLGQRGVIAVRGVDQAARVFFGKELKDLTLAEAATLAGMIQSPSRYSPVRHNDAARTRRNTVLGTMVRDGFIPLEKAAATATEPLALADFDPARESVAPYFIDYVNRYGTGSGSDRVIAGSAAGEPQAGMSAQDAPATLTTLDLDLQQLAAAAVRKQLERLDKIYQPRGLTPQVAFVALDPKTGNVLAMIGGRDYAESQMNRVTDAQRQPGSVFKPFVYAAALESGMSPLRMFKDAPQEFTYDRKFKYRPANYGGGFSMRDVPMRTGLIKSLNVVTVDVAIQTGLVRVANTAQQFGLPRPVPYPALALGTTEATPLQIATAYAAFANGGSIIQPNVFAQTETVEPVQVIQPTTAFVITDMLEGVIDHGTARAARGLIPKTALAGKTGTSRDGWFVGYTPNLVCAVWIGFDDNRQLGLTGAESALPIWTEFMKSAVDLRPELGGKSFAEPDGITIAEIDPETDELATSRCPTHERIAILTSQAPRSECFRHGFYFDLPSDVQTVEPTVAARSLPPREPKNRPKSPTAEFAGLRDTRVDTDKRGRSVLVNEMRVTGR